VVLIVRQTSKVKLRFFGHEKDRATGSPLLGLVICYEIAQKGAKMPLKMQK